MVVAPSLSPSTTATFDKLTYSTETTAALPSDANLSAVRKYLAATGNTTAGYFGGGRPTPGVVMNKTTYSTETTAALPSDANLSSSRYYISATSARSNALPTTAAPSAPATRFSDGAGPSPNAGYYGGGFSGGSALSTMDKTDFASDTTAAVPGAALSGERASFSGATGNSTDGYFGGGYSYSVPGSVSTMDKVTYSSDTTAAVPGANLSAARSYAAATGTADAGYFGGEFLPSSVSTMDKTTYSSDTTAAVPGAALSSARHSATATGNTTAGYFGGGFPGPKSTMDKTTYSTDTTAAVPGANLSSARYGTGATGNSTAGYFGGGAVSIAISSVDKVTYSSDTTAAVPGANLSVKRAFHGATGNSTDGYFMCGDSFPAPTRYPTSVDKLSYSTETAAEVPGAAGSILRFRLGASSAKSQCITCYRTSGSNTDSLNISLEGSFRLLIWVIGVVVILLTLVLHMSR